MHYMGVFSLPVSWNATGFWLTIKGVDWWVHNAGLCLGLKMDLARFASRLLITCNLLSLFNMEYRNHCLFYNCIWWA